MRDRSNGPKSTSAARELETDRSMQSNHGSLRARAESPRGSVARGMVRAIGRTEAGQVFQRAPMSHLLIIFYSFLLSRVLPKTESSNNHWKYDGVFPEDYDKYEAPVVDGGPVQVYLLLSIMDVDNINEGTMDFSIQMYVSEIWTDPRLNLDRFKGKFSTIFPNSLLEDIWKPDLIFDNAKTGELFKLSIPNTGARVRPDGEFRRSTRYNLKIGCQMFLKYYPMDIQHCFLKTALFSNPDHKAELHWVGEEQSPYRKDFPNSIKFTRMLEPLKYTLEEPIAYKEKELWPSGNYTYLYANFTFVRRLSSNIMNMYIPSTLVVVLSWLSFWLDVTAVPARITLGVTSLLTLATQVVQARSLLPPVNYMTALDIWLFVCILMVFCSIIEFAVAYHLNFVMTKRNAREAENKVVPVETTWIQGNSGKETPQRKRDSSASPPPDSTSPKAMYRKFKKWRFIFERLKKSTSLDLVCRKLFPLTFLTFVSFYWLYFLVLK